ncbi:hypothetical protein ASD04_14040 [Devosia sp. Root436]|jgi:hypothetical protein|uniref:hypothetical protein n=1 Tax=Devosia sp. Root436 TaxID=1736537 RepID=UPI0006FB5EF2|nr:hypothetical protein [Devosia sp. Root436]KQX35172.1 hypothetical protein ASD04_14040 [Devosia sp. Root436]
MADKITRFNLHEYSISAQMEYRKARRAEALAAIEKSSQLANSFAAISNNRAAEEGNLFSRIAMQRMQGQLVSKRA